MIKKSRQKLSRHGKRLLSSILVVAVITSMIPFFTIDTTAETLNETDNLGFNVIAYDTAVRIEIPYIVDAKNYKVYISSKENADLAALNNDTTKRAVLNSDEFVPSVYALDDDIDVLDNTKIITIFPEHTYYFYLVTDDNTLHSSFATETKVSGDCWTSKGNYDISWYNTTDNVFYINSAEELAGLAVLNNGLNEVAAVDFTGKTFYLTASVDLSAHQWTPIGINNIRFYGSFDGGVYEGDSLVKTNVIKGLFTNIDVTYIGLFGCAIGNIKNIGIVDNYIKGYSRVGAIVGYTEGSLHNCFNTGIVKGCSNVGGIAGVSTGTEISNCYNTGKIIGSSFVAGIFGGGGNDSFIVSDCYNTGEVTADSYAAGISPYFRGEVRSCYNAGTITATNDGSAGIIACNNSGGKINYSYNIGDISGNKYVGGITGMNYGSALVSHCYNTGSVTGTGDTPTAIGGITGNHYRSTIKNSYNIGAVSATDGVTYIGSIAGMLGYDGVSYYLSLDKILNCAYLKDTAEFAAGSSSDTTGLCNDKSSIINKITVESDGVWTEPQAKIISGALFYGVNKSCPVLKTFGYSEDESISIPQDTDGTYLIKNAYQLDALRSIEGRVSVKLLNNIDISPIQYNRDKSSYGNWSPIGNSEGKFEGFFDGNGFSISGLHYKNSYGSTVGLFKYNYGIIKNLGVTSSYIRCYSTSGVFTSSNHGVLSNCYNTGNLYASGSSTGAFTNSNCGSVNNCYNTGVVFAQEAYAGGIVGYCNSTGTITTCYNIGKVYGKEYVGGIVGIAQGSVTNCYNKSRITGISYVGGICGSSSSEITNCYNTGNINGECLIGGIAGTYNSSTDIMSNCYNTGNIKSSITNPSSIAYAGGIVGNISSAQLSNSYNIGKVDALKYTGGIAGQSYKGTISNTYYSGSSVGVGNDSSNTVTVPFVQLEQSTIKCGETTAIVNQTTGLENNLGADFSVSYSKNESDQTNIASVTDSTVFGRASGSANITCEFVITQNELDMVGGTGFTGKTKTFSVPVSMPITVTKATPDLSLDTGLDWCTIGDTIILTANISNDYNASGTVTFYNGDDVIGTKTLYNSSASIYYHTTSAGYINLRAVYSGDDNNEVASESKFITVYKKQPRLNLEITPDSPTEYPRDVELKATLTNAYGSIEGQDITFDVDGTPYTAQLNASGVATYTFTPNAGTYNLSARYEGDSNNESVSTGDHSYMILKGQQTTPTISINGDTTVTYGNNYTDYKVTASGGNGTGSYLYRSSDDSVISVDSNTGSLSVNGAGTATIFVKRQGDENYNDSTEDSITITVEKRDMVITVEAGDKVYDGTTMVTSGSIHHNNVIESDYYEINLLNWNVEFKDKNVGNDKEISISGIELSEKIYRNYNVSYDVQTANITPAPLTVINTAVNDKVYDGTMSAEFSVTPALDAVCGTDDASLVIGTPTFASKDHSDTAITVNFTDFSLSGIDATNYTLTQPESVSAFINKRILNVSVDPITINTHQSIPPLEVQISGFIEGEDASTIPGFVVPTAYHDYYKSTSVPVNVDMYITYSNGNPSNNYEFNYSHDTHLTIQAVYISDDDFTVSGNYSKTENPENWNNENLYIRPTNGYDWISKDGHGWTTCICVRDELKNGEISFQLWNTSNGTQTEFTTIYYNLDKTAPTGTISIADNDFKSFLNTISFGLFFDETVDVTITGEDNLSGVKSIEYQKVSEQSEYDENGTWTSGSEFSVTPDEKFVVYARITDEAGNVTIINSHGVITDNTAPEITVTYADDNVWTSDENAKITVDVTDNLSGIKEISYTIDGSEPVISEQSSFEITNLKEENYVVSITATDNSGNLDTKNVTVKIDRTAVITVSGNTTDYLQCDTVTGIMKCGGSGFAKVEVKKDNEDYVDITDSYSEGYSVTTNGVYTFKVTNGAGAFDTAVITYENIDTAKPVVNINRNGYTENSWSTQNVTLTVTNITDNLGITSLQVSLDGTAFTAFDGTYVVEENDSTLYFRAISESGVVSEVKEFTVKVDKTAPSGTISIADNNFKSFLNTISFGLFFDETVDVTITGEDNLSGVKSIEYQKVSEQSEYDENGTWTSGSEFSVTPDEKFIVYARITDEAGNVNIINSDGVVVYTNSVLETSEAYFDTNTEKSGYKDISVEISLNSNTLKEIKNGEYVLIKDTDYTVTGNTVTLKKEYLKTVVDGTVTLVFSFNALGEEYVSGDEPEEAEFTVTKIIHAQTPEFKTNLSGDKTYTKGDAAEALTVEAVTDDSGEISYQWYVTDDSNVEGTAIDGETANTFMPKTDKTGVFYYYVVATNTNNTVNGETVSAAASEVYKVTVNNLEVLEPKADEGVPQTVLQGDSEQITEAVLSKTDKEKLSDGSNISIYLKIEDKADNESDKESVSNSLNGKTLGQYIDISLLKSIDGEEIKVEETNAPLRITVDIPENLRALNRTFSIVRVHNGVSQTLEDLDDNPNTITFETNLFSTYAIIYKDTVNENPGDSPKTGDSYPIIPVMLGLGMFSVALCYYKKLRRMILIRK